MHAASHKSRYMSRTHDLRTYTRVLLQEGIQRSSLSAVKPAKRRQCIPSLSVLPRLPPSSGCWLDTFPAQLASSTALRQAPPFCPGSHRKLAVPRREKREGAVTTRWIGRAGQTLADAPRITPSATQTVLEASPPTDRRRPGWTRRRLRAPPIGARSTACDRTRITATHTDNAQTGKDSQ